MREEDSKVIWHTGITAIEPGKIKLRGRPIEELMEKASFSDSIYFLLKGEFPPANHGRVMNAILVSSLDHGVSPPSVLSCRTILSGGNPLNAAVAGGILAIGEAHGGAIEACARLLCERADEGKESENARNVVSEYRDRGERIPGFGHRLHKADPRSGALVTLAEKEGLSGKYLKLALAIQEELEKTAGRELPLNVDGTIAALILEMGFDWRLGKGFFIISRTPGLVAHAFEERLREKPMRKMGSFKTIYDGPEEK